MEKKTIIPFSDDTVFSLLASAAFFVPLVFYYGTFEKYETAKALLFGILTGAALLVFLIQKRSFKFNRFLFFSASFFAVWALLTTLTSENWINSLLGSELRWKGLAFYLNWAVYMLLLISVLTKEKFIFLLKILLVGGIFISVAAITQAYGIGYYDGVQTIGYVIRPPAFLGNADFSAMFLAALIPFGLVFFSDTKKLGAKIYYVVSLFVIIFGVAVLSSRGTFVGFGVAAGLFFIFLTAAKHKRLAYTLLVATAAFILLSYGFYNAVRPAATQGQQSSLNIQSRIQVWKGALDSIRHNPLFGVGIGNYIYIDQQHKVNDVEASVRFDDAHNLALMLAAEAGVPLLLAIAALIGYCLVLGFRNFRDPVLAAATSALLGFSVSAMFTPVPIGCWVLLAVLVSIFGIEKTETFNFNAGFKYALVVFAAASVVFYTFFFAGEIFLYNSMVAEAMGNYPMAIKLASTAANFNPLRQNALIWETKGKIESGNISGQEITIQKFLNMDQRGALSHAWAANFYQALYKKTGQQQYRNAALSNADVAIALDPKNYLRYQQAAYYNYTDGNPDKAYRYVQSEVQLNPRDFQGFVFLAKLQAGQGKAKEAVASFTTAYDLQPTPALKHLLEDMRKRRDPLKDFDYSIGLGPIQ